MYLILIKILLILFFISVFILLYFYNKKDDFPMDVRAINYVKSIENIRLNRFFKIVTTIGDPTSIVLLTLIISIIFYRNNLHKDALFFSLNVIIVWLFNEILKLIFKRERPHIKVLKVRGYSLPSGHAMVFMAYSIISIYFLILKFNHSWIIYVVSLIIFFLNISVGLSRVYFRVHYLSDVIAGWYAGFIFTILSIAFHILYY
ncbi:phosphatase PAP2 family protein [Clostridium malenominatum]|uniref:Phosphatase PAP2 family protein n=1 Tax=Clostridium malenominatum TaxID=1539 RepID=A0ABP3U404_9CLOT